MIQTVSPPSTPVALTLFVELQSGSESALLRALTLLHRRRCRVLEAGYRSGSTGGQDRLTLRVEAPPRHAHCVATWLSALVDVRAVTAGPVGARLSSGT